MERNHTCSHDCGSCGGCGRSLSLTPGELDMLKALGQIPFQPVARGRDSTTPVYLGETELEEKEAGLLLECLEKKGLISLDYDKPLQGFDSAAYKGFPLRGSMALTARGQDVLELLEVQGIQEDA